MDFRTKIGDGDDEDDDEEDDDDDDDDPIQGAYVSKGLQPQIRDEFGG